jgi:hypothetical protein
VRLTAQVPNNAPYSAKHVLDLGEVSVNNGAISVREDDGLHVAAYFGDTTGNAGYSAADALQALRVAVGLDSGFAAYQLADPVIVADITGNGIVNATDANRILQEVVGLDRPEIPPLPGVLPPIVPGGPDPFLRFPKDLRARPGQIVRVPLRLTPFDGLQSADLAIAYDTSRLEILDVRRGTLTASFDLFAVHVDAAAGTIRVGLGRSAGPITGTGTGDVLQVMVRIKPDAPAGRAALNLRRQLGAISTQLNEGGLDLIPDPSDAAGDLLDGAITVRGHRAKLRFSLPSLSRLR